MGILDSIEKMRIKVHGKDKAKEMTDAKYGDIHLEDTLELSHKAHQAIEKEKSDKDEYYEQKQREERLEDDEMDHWKSNKG